MKMTILSLNVFKKVYNLSSTTSRIAPFLIYICWQLSKPFPTRSNVNNSIPLMKVQTSTHPPKKQKEISLNYGLHFSNQKLVSQFVIQYPLSAQSNPPNNK